MVRVDHSVMKEMAWGDLDAMSNTRDIVLHHEEAKPKRGNVASTSGTTYELSSSVPRGRE